MAESVQQAAIRKARELDVLATVYDAVLAMRECIAETTRLLAATTGRVEQLHAENAELRDGMLALSNRVEALTRGIHVGPIHSDL